MSRFGLLLALLSLLFVDSYAQLTLNASAAPASGLGAVAGRQWTVVRGNGLGPARWNPRSGGVVEWYTGSTRALQGTSPTVRTIPGPMMLLYGVGVWTGSSEEDRQDVWYSTNKGLNWGLVYQDPTQPGFSPLLSATTVQDSKGRQFRIQGAEAQPNNPNAGAAGDVYMSSTGGFTWVKRTDLPSGEGRFLSQAVVDSRDCIYVTMGQYNDGLLQDVWVSCDLATSSRGGTWTPVTVSGPAPPPRAVHGSVVGKYADGTDAIYVMYGYATTGPNVGNVYRNDVWVSTTGGKRWTQLLANAPWAARGDCQIEITPAGVIIIAGGVSSAAGIDKRELNDVWASMDGGYSWGQCTDNAEFSDRQFPYTVLDDEGYLYVMGGLENDNGGRQVNDVWRSAFSYYDLDEVARRCNLFIPSCGVGLKCLQGVDDDFSQGLWGVSCAACPYTAGASPVTPAASNTMTILFVVFLLLFLATLALLLFSYYRMRASGVSSPIPLPAGAQRWWNSNTGAQVGGLDEGLNKGTTGADTYSQLSIRDQM